MSWKAAAQGSLAGQEGLARQGWPRVWIALRFHWVPRTAVGTPVNLAEPLGRLPRPPFWTLTTPTAGPPVPS